MWPSTPHLTKRRKVEEIITHPLRYYVGDRNHPRNSNTMWKFIFNSLLRAAFTQALGSRHNQYI